MIKLMNYSIRHKKYKIRNKILRVRIFLNGSGYYVYFFI